MSSAVLLSLVLASAPPPLVAEERAPAVMLIVVPKDVAPSAPTSAFLAAAARAFRAHTTLELRSVEQAGFDQERIDRCERETRLHCWVSAMLPARVLLAITILPYGTGEDRLSAMLIDLEQARACADEDCIFAGAVRVAPVVVKTAEDAALAAYFEALVTRELRARLEARGVYGPLAAIAEVKPASPMAPAPSAEEPLRAAMLYGGIGASLSGAALLVYALAKSSGVEARCVVAADHPEASCMPLGFATFGFDANAVPTADRERVNPAGLPILSLAIGLLASGATWLLLPELVDVDSLLELGAGFGVGLVFFGATVAIDPR